tara:strand:- start:568 stop:984 length:417 start_codon:yes stop_codon:yes gene_type:complete
MVQTVLLVERGLTARSHAAWTYLLLAVRSMASMVFYFALQDQQDPISKLHTTFDTVQIISHHLPISFSLPLLLLFYVFLFPLFFILPLYFLFLSLVSFFTFICIFTLFFLPNQPYPFADPLFPVRVALLLALRESAPL